MKHPHYHKDVSSYDTIDVYDVLALFEVKSHPVGHAIKKLLMAGRRGAKDYRQDLQEAIDSILREIDMQTPPEPEKRTTGDSSQFWNDAPEWAQWVAKSPSGQWHWCAFRPSSSINWKSTPIQRPESK